MMLEQVNKEAMYVDFTTEEEFREEQEEELGEHFQEVLEEVLGEVARRRDRWTSKTNSFEQIMFPGFL